MTTKTLLLAVMLTFGAASVMAQTTTGSSSGGSATSPDPQTAPDRPVAPGSQTSDSTAAPLAPGDQSSSALQSKIADALHNEPTLGSSNVSVTVSERTIDLSGTVGSTKDKQTAERIAESFDGNRQLNDKIQVTGRGHSDLAPGHSALNNGGTGNAPNPATNSGSNNSSGASPRQ